MENVPHPGVCTAPSPAGKGVIDKTPLKKRFDDLNQGMMDYAVTE
jgi:hypothetical protein